MSLISQGLAQNLIKFDDENKYITYVHQNKKRNFTNPEEQVQAETFLKLILIYGYDQVAVVCACDDGIICEGSGYYCL